MDKEKFEKLHPLAKVNYVAIQLAHARSLFQNLYDNARVVDDNMIDIIESLGDDFVRFGIAAEDGATDSIFDELNDCIARLEQLSVQAKQRNSN